MVAFKRVVVYLDKALATITHRVSNFGQITLMAMVLLVVVDVCLRRLFNSPLSWSLEVVQILLVVVVFFSVAYCAARQGHIAIGALVSRFSEKTQMVIEVGTNTLGVCVYGMMCWGSITLAQHAQHVHRITGMLPIPVYPFMLAVALGSLLLALVILVKTLWSIIEAVER